jgi:hypothetical protein
MIRVPLKKVRKTPKAALLFVLILSFSYLTYFLFIHPCKSDPTHSLILSILELGSMTVFYLLTSLCVTDFVFFLFASLKDPGYVEENFEKAKGINERRASSKVDDDLQERKPP